MSAKCRSCGKEIVWAKTVTGAPIPLDAVSEKRLVFRKGSTKVEMVDTYQTHFATCKDADKWRKM